MVLPILCSLVQHRFNFSHSVLIVHCIHKDEISSLVYILKLLVKSTIKEISEELNLSYLSKLYASVNLH